MKPRIVIGALTLCLAGTAIWGIQRQPPRDKGEGASVHEDKASSFSPTERENPRLSSVIERIVDPGLYWEERLTAVRELPSRLGDESVARLFAFLGEPPASGEENWYLVCNEIMEIFRKRNIAPDLYTRHLSALISSPKADPTIRDYACQHLAQWISGIEPQGTEPDEALAASAFDVMAEVAARPENGELTLPGTAVNALTDTVLNGTEAMQARGGRVAKLAMTVLNDESFATFNRTSAMQAAARLNAPGLAERCRGFAADDKAPTDLRLSAIASLGLVGSADDTVLLESFATNNSFKHAAASALRRLTAGAE